MKKRKLTRKNLDELAKVMPVLSEEVQACCWGGAVYFDENGNRLNRVGSSDEIRVISTTEFNQILQLSVDDPDCNYGGEALKSSSESIKNKIFQFYVSQYAPNATSYKIGNSNGNFAHSTSDGKIVINESSSGIYNENDLISVLQHENIHLSYLSGGFSGNVDDNTARLMFSSLEYELNTLMKQISLPEFQYTSTIFKESIALAIHDTWNKLAIFKSIDEARQLCGL